MILTRGVALGSALTLCCASVAQAASGAHAATAVKASSAAQSAVTKAQAASGGENTPLKLSSTAAKAHAASSGGGSGILRTIIALVVVCGIIYAVARIMRAVKGRDAVRASGQGLSQIATLPLGTNRSVSLLRAGTDVVLVGVTEQGVTALKTYTEAEALAAGLDVPPTIDADFDQVERPMSRALDGLRRLTVRP